MIALAEAPALASEGARIAPRRRADGSRIPLATFLVRDALVTASLLVSAIVAPALTLVTLVAFCVSRVTKPSLKALKQTALVPCGLGAVCLYAHMERVGMDASHMRIFIQAAVLINISAMAFIQGDESLKFALSRATTLALCLWLVASMASVQFNNVFYEHNLFLFKGVDAPWVAVHAAYRLLLCGLAFGPSSRVYYTLELKTLVMTTVLHLVTGVHPTQAFGFADTVSAASLAICDSLWAVREDGQVTAAPRTLERAAVLVLATSGATFRVVKLILP